MTYQELWRPLTRLYDEREAKSIALLILERLYGLTQADVLCGKVADKADDESDLRILQQRLLRGEPVQYVLGEAEFCGLLFHVEPGVLIPRPETQWMCNFVSESWGVQPRKGAILDIGTGSGCIACTTALNLADSPAEVVAWDISDRALRIARNNAARLGAKVVFEKHDIFCPPSDSERWDVIVSNPPYVCEHEKVQMESRVKDYEPQLALFVPDDDPLLFYRAIGCYAVKALKPEGYLLVEINAQYGNDVGLLFESQGFSHVKIFKDFADKDRFVLAYKP